MNNQLIRGGGLSQCLLGAIAMFATEQAQLAAGVIVTARDDGFIAA